MDPKASAKSKRGHSQRGRKSHPTPSAVAQKKKQQPQPAPAAGGGGGGEEKPRAQRRSLPSNWDRYDEDDDEEVLVLGDEKSVGTKVGFGEVAPKSKGADFRHLIEQARSQTPELRRLDSKGSFFLEDFTFDFVQGTSSMLSAKGKGLASWCEDDNFIVEDELASSYEVPFLAMDLHAIADQLSTLKLSQRLFVEADLFPEEMCDDAKESQIHNESGDSREGRHKDGLGTPSSIGHALPEKNVERVDTGNFNIDQRIMVEKLQALPSKESELTEISQSGLDKISMTELSMQSSTSLEQNTASQFEAAEAEAELDMLLNSLDETSEPSSNLHPQTHSSAMAYYSRLGALVNAGPSSIGQATTSSGVIGASSLDDAIDDLLGETSDRIKVKQDTASLPKEGTTKFPSASIGGSLLNGAASLRQPTRTSTLDDALDDLLAETSVSLKDQKNTAGPQKQGTSSVAFPSKSPLGTKPIDEFDFWFDTIK